MQTIASSSHAKWNGKRSAMNDYQIAKTFISISFFFLQKGTTTFD